MNRFGLSSSRTMLNGIDVDLATGDAVYFKTSKGKEYYGILKDYNRLSGLSPKNSSSRNASFMFVVSKCGKEWNRNTDYNICFIQMGGYSVVSILSQVMRLHGFRYCRHSRGVFEGRLFLSISAEKSGVEYLEMYHTDGAKIIDLVPDSVFIQSQNNISRSGFGVFSKRCKDRDGDGLVIVSDKCKSLYASADGGYLIDKFNHRLKRVQCGLRKVLRIEDLKSGDTILFNKHLKYRVESYAKVVGSNIVFFCIGKTQDVAVISIEDLKDSNNEIFKLVVL